MPADKLPLREPTIGEHVKVFGKNGAHEVMSVRVSQRDVILATANQNGRGLKDVPCNQLLFLDLEG